MSIIIAVAALVIFYAAYLTGIQSFLFAWVLNFMLMMCLLSITETFKPKLATSFYKTKTWEKDGKIYKWAGVNVFRKLLVWVGWEKLNKKANPVKKNAEALTRLEYMTRQSEFGHLVIFLIVLAITIFVLIEFGFKGSLWLLSLNLLLNVYPVFVQRYNRPRLKRSLRYFRKPEN